MTGVWASPNYHRATLIQAYRGFLGELEPHLFHALNKYGIEWKNKLKVLQWILAEELWLCYLLVDITHSRGHDYAKVHNELRQNLPFNLSGCFMHYFVVADFTSREHAISIEVDEVGFYIRYYTNEIQPMARIIQNGTTTY